MENLLYKKFRTVNNLSMWWCVSLYNKQKVTYFKVTYFIFNLLN